MSFQIPNNSGVKPLNVGTNSSIHIPIAEKEQINDSSITIPKPSQDILRFLSSSGIKLFGILANDVIDGEFTTDEINEQTQNSVQDLVRNPNKIFEPDAIPDGKGGYTSGSTGYWIKKLSSVTGLPVMSAITFVGTTYTALNGQSVTIPTITFEMVFISMIKGRLIEKTEITGRSTGSVKEYIGAKDWSINIKAIIAASQNVSDGMTSYYQNGKYPEENMEKIDLLLNAPIAIRIICPYMNKRGIEYIVIDDGVDISQIEGEYEIQRIDIPCVSDNPLIIQVASQ